MLFVVLLLLCMGCGDGFPKRYSVSGVVRFRDGSPVETGTIEIGIPNSHWTASGKIQKDGSFVLTTIQPGDGAIEGNHRVIIRQLILTYVPAQERHEHGKLVPLRYADYSTSGLELTVERRRNDGVEIIIDEK
jgi:hypothetical protein